MGMTRRVLASLCAAAVCHASAPGIATSSAPGDDVGLAEIRRVEELQRLVTEQRTLIQQQFEYIRSLEELGLAVRKLEGTSAENGTTSTADLGEIQRVLSGQTTAMDHMWMILCGALVMFMQTGFAMLEAGTCRAGCVQNILLKNLTDLCVGAISWFFVGFSFAFGGPTAGTDSDGNAFSHSTSLQYAGQKFIGWNYFATHDFSEADADGNFTTSNLYVMWVFHWAFCSASATIVSGGVAERVQFPGYVLFSFVMTGFVYPVGVAWTWGRGWLARGEINDIGFMDYAGSGIVHMVGGVGALVGATIAGPRHGRWDCPENFIPHNLPLIALGTFILWFCWYGFNCGASMQLHDERAAHMVALVAVNTTMSAASAGLSALIYKLMIYKYNTGEFRYDLRGMCNGIVCGLVSITASCSSVEPGSAVCIGLVGSLFYVSTSHLLLRIGIDDPVDAFAVHGACGFWGVMAAPLFDHGTGFKYANGWSGFRCWRGEDGACGEVWDQMFAANLLLVVCLASWSAMMSTLVFLPLRLLGLLRCDDILQEIGMDEAKHTPSKAYQLATTASAAGQMPAYPSSSSGTAPPGNSVPY